MTKLLRIALLCLILAIPVAASAPRSAAAAGESPALTISGYVRNEHGEGVSGATVTVAIVGSPGGAPIGATSSARSDEEGGFIARLPLSPQQEAALELPETQVVVETNRPTFSNGQAVIPATTLADEDAHYYADVDIVVQRKPTVAVLLAGLILVGVYVLISLELVHRTVAALLGAAAILVITHVLGAFSPDLVILPFERAVSYVDLNVILLLMSMMVLVTITARTGIFQWLAVAVYRMSSGSTWRLAVLLTVATAVLSAFLDNVTTMLLMVPITLEIALILRLNALALLLPEVFASNIGGAATLIGDPPNLLIASYADLSFGSFIVNMGPAAAVSMVGLIIMMRFLFAGQYPQSPPEETSELLHRLETEFVIKDMRTLRHALIVFGGVVVMFLLTTYFHMEPAVPALLGLAVLLVWTKADIVQELEAVEWPSLIFFIALFIVIGAANETGVIQMVADAVAYLAGGDLTKAILLVIWIAAFASMLVDNIPITATMLPVVAYLTATIPGAGNSMYWALAFGACFGGNGTIVGASANIITVGLAERAGSSVTFGQFLRKGLPVTIMSLLVATGYVLLMARMQ